MQSELAEKMDRDARRQMKGGIIGAENQRGKEGLLGCSEDCQRMTPHEQVQLSGAVCGLMDFRVAWNVNFKGDFSRNMFHILNMFLKYLLFFFFSFFK